MYYLVPAIVSIIIFWVLSPKSASLIKGSGLPETYLVLSRIFSGFKSRCVIRWLWSSCTPLLICKIHSKLYFSLNLLSLQRLRASLSNRTNTKEIHLSNTKWYTKQPQVVRWYRRFSGCYRFRLYVAIRLSASILRYLRYQPYSSSLCEWRLSLWDLSRKLERPYLRRRYLCEGSLADQLCLLQIVLFFEIWRPNSHY